MSNNEEDKMITVREAAEECGRNAETVRRWIWSGKLPAEKLGNQLFVKRSALASFCSEVAAPKATTALSFLDRAEALQERMKARGAAPLDAAEAVRKMRGERMSQLG
jgi:excisionase family DNA binding protein